MKDYNPDCNHTMVKLSGWRNGTKCSKCGAYLPYGLTWIPLPEKEQVSKPLDQSQTLYDLGVMAERERIIKLLEDALEERRKESISLMGWKYGKNWTPSMNSGVLGGMTLCLALIKGENK